ncbi:hypothetical protein VSDG_03203 [Cytospora chrysosperma]|uniref:C2H2-type domain-containing protein n=1 Tax=Cytospora chrysosperma TaxID=252740 RepID=A0A423WBI8_CYTCH|nr:hypothetical protein VSDG_03203 [Valsa sordida]
MDIRGARPAPPDPGTPTGRYDDDRYASSLRPFGAHGPFNPNYEQTHSPGGVGIPNASSHHVPPPLPPPRYVPGVAGPQPPSHDDFYNRQRKPSYNESVFGGRSESVYGSLGQSWRPAQDECADYRRRESNTTLTGRDEGYSSLSSYASSGSRERAPSFRVHDQYQVPSSSSISYDNQQLKKLDAKRTLDNRSPPRGSALSASMRSLQEGPVGWASGDRPIQLPQLSLPTRSKAGILESPRYTDTPLSSAVSPRSTPFAQISRPQEYRSSPIEPPSAIEFNQSPYARSRRHNSGFLPDELTPADTYEHEMEFSLEETSRFRQLHIDDGQHSRMNSFDNQSIVSLKRRASSPPVEDGALRQMSSQGDLLRRREGASRGSPAPRLSLNPPHGSISSLSSGDRSGSLGGLSTATSMTSSLSFGRRSPIGLSPTDTATSPFAAPNSLTLSPRSTITPRTSVHQRGPSDQRNMASPRKLTEPIMRPTAGVGKIQGFYMCDCCPKKPKKFDTREELSAHEAEKQYECAYCGNRFKNKNEAERHQNSLHEFARSGLAPAGHVRHVTEQDWDERVRHLQDHHKFRECNSSKKFYRADHFRQHLKHSHAGTSGKWTNMLENACMMEEEPPPPPPGR